MEKKLPTHFNIKISSRCNDLLLSLRDSYFPVDENNKDDQLTLGEFVYTLCCSLIYNKPKKKK